MTTRTETSASIVKAPHSEGERREMLALGLLDARGEPLSIAELKPASPGAFSVQRRAIVNKSVLNEAYDYTRPSSFSRGTRVDLRSGSSFLWISGTASIGDGGETLYKGDFRAQCWRTYRNITELLGAEGATWRDIVRTTCYLRDIERDYDEFNQVRTYFLAAQGLDPLPASTGIQARLCREDLLVEIEAIAMLDQREASG